MANNRFLSLENLPNDIIEKELARFTNKTDLGNLSCVSKSLNALFSMPLQVTKLLECVKEANYIGARQLVTTNPLLMFQEAAVLLFQEDEDGEEGIIKREYIISPLELAFRLFDTKMWRIFYTTVENDDQLKTLFMRKAYETKLMYDDFELVKAAYTEFLEVGDIQGYFQGALIYFDKDSEVGKHWFALGEVQLKILPKHMMIEFCKLNSVSWNYGPTFPLHGDNNQIVVSNLGIPTQLNKLKAKGFALYRGANTITNGKQDAPHCMVSFLAKKDPKFMNRILEDKDLIQNLFAAREQELCDLKEKAAKFLQISAPAPANPA